MRRFGSRCGAICKVVPLIKSKMGRSLAPHFAAVSAAAAAVVTAAAVIVAAATAIVAAAAISVK
mgnify:CR=1 FL=1